MTDVVIQQHSRKLLMLDILMSETCWAHKKWNKTASDIKLVFHSSTIKTYLRLKNMYLYVNLKLPSSKSWRLRRGMDYWDYIINLAFCTTRTALSAGRNLPPRKFLGTHFCYKLSGTQGCWMWTERVGHLKISNYATGIRTRRLPSCGAVPQPNTSLLYVRTWNMICKTRGIWHLQGSV